MTKTVRLLGKKLPVWLIAMLCIAASAGAAVGTVLQGNVVGHVPVAVSQALEVGTPTSFTIDWSCEIDMPANFSVPQSVYCRKLWTTPDRFVGAHSDDQTAFQFAAEVATGDQFPIYVPLKNSSHQELVGELTLAVPEGITVEVGRAEPANVIQLARTGLCSWKFKLGPDAIKTPPLDYDVENQDCLIIFVAVSDVIVPGFYTIAGQIQQISY